MKALLTTLAVIEFGAGLGMLAVPSFVGEILLGSPFGTTIEPVIARVAGIALLALAVACWLLRNEGWSRATRGLVGAMLLYNGGGTGVLLYAGPGLGLYGTGFWPAVLVHAVMAVWCLLSLLRKPGQIPASE
jgi:hypothetical protein